MCAYNWYARMLEMMAISAHCSKWLPFRMTMTNAYAYAHYPNYWWIPSHFPMSNSAQLQCTWGAHFSTQSLWRPFQRLVSRALVHFSHWKVSQVPIHTSINSDGSGGVHICVRQPANGIRSEFLPAARIFWKYHRNVAEKGGETKPNQAPSKEQTA